MKAPCKGCPDRAVGCHGQCGRYAEYRGERDKIKSKKEREALSAELVSASYHRIQKIKRKKKW